MPIILHADDFGITRSATQGILSAWTDEALDRFSIMANGRHLEWGRRILETFERQPQRLAIHLNILEEVPLSDPVECPLLFNESGKFPFSFLTLFRWQKRSPHERQTLSQQVTCEWRQQIIRAKTLFPRIKVWSLDSHQHVHVIPWLWEIVFKLAREFSIMEIRIPQDQLFSHLNIFHPRHWPKPQNFAKVRLINHLIKQNFIHKLYSPIFIGGLYYSGEMHRFPIKALRETLARQAEEIELLFHPGDESPLCNNDQLSFAWFYQHKNRMREMKALLDFVEKPSPHGVASKLV